MQDKTKEQLRDELLQLQQRVTELEISVAQHKQVEEALKAQSWQQAVVAELGQYALKTTDLAMLLEEAVTLVGQTLEVEYCMVLELLPEGKAFLLRAGFGWKEGYVGQATVGVGTDSQAGYTLISREPVIVEDFQTETRFSAPPLLRDHNVVSGMSVIIHGPDRPFGILVAHTTRRRKFIQDEVYFIQAVANVLSAAIEHKRTEEALQQSEERYRCLVEAAPDAIAVICEDKLVYINPAGVKFFGATSIKELISIPILDLISPDFRLIALDRMRRVLNEGKIAPLLEVKLLRVDGKIIEAELAGIPTTYGGKPAIQVICRDITERKRAEEALQESERKYRSLFEDSRDAIWITTREGRFVDINKSALDLYGYTREEMIGMNVQGLYVNPDERSKFQQEIEQKGFLRDYEVKLRKKDGTEIDCLFTATIWRANDGTILGYQGVIRDITEKQKMEQELLKAQKLESIGILAGGIAHDFNNILTAILGNITLAKMYTTAEDRIFERLEEAEKASLRAKDLTQQLLTFSKGGTPIKRTASIAELVRESASFALRGSNVRCELSLPTDLWPVEVDEGQMSQVINNLIINANHAMPKGGIIKICAENITVEGRHTLPLKEGNYVRLSIKDQGIGISEEHLSKIFDPYFTTKEKGSGLGLATTYSIIKNHDGYITVESEMGVGTTFHIYLPTSQAQILTKKDMEEKPLIGKGKILVMDDEEIIRDIAGEMLSHIGYEVEFAKDGTEAIELYKQAKKSGQPFMAVILDLTVPGGMGGKDTIQKLLEIDPAIKAIVSSGYSDDPIMTDCKQYGFCAVIAKPYKAQELGVTLHKVLIENE